MVEMKAGCTHTRKTSNGCLIMEAFFVLMLLFGSEKELGLTC